MPLGSFHVRNKSVVKLDGIGARTRLVFSERRIVLFDTFVYLVNCIEEAEVFPEAEFMRSITGNFNCAIPDEKIPSGNSKHSVNRLEQ